MSKLKVGDKVKVVKAGCEFPDRLLNVVGTVSQEYAYHCQIAYEGERYTWGADVSQVELVDKSTKLKMGDRVNYIGKDVQIKAGNPYFLGETCRAREDYVWIKSINLGNLHGVATKNLIKIEEPKEPFAYVKTEERPSSNVVHPKHYNNHPSGIECWDIIEHMNYSVGSAIKYIWRHADKGDPIENLEKAIECIKREIERIKKFGVDSSGNPKDSAK